MKRASSLFPRPCLSSRGTGPGCATRKRTMFHTTEDIRIQWTKVVLPPVFLEEENPVTEAASATIYNARNEIVEILNGRDSRLLVLAGPCSIHDTKAAREYASLLKTAIQEFSADLRIVMRVYLRSPAPLSAGRDSSTIRISTSRTRSTTGFARRAGCCWTWRRWASPLAPNSWT